MAGASAGLGRPRAVLFDWDNTLVDNWAVIHEAMNATLTAMGQAPWSLEQAKARVRASMRDSFPRLFGARWPEARRIYYDSFAATHLARLREMPGASAMLAAFAAGGLYLGVVSNKNGRFLRLEAERLGWTGYFGRLVGATDAARDKPAPDPVALALTDSGIAPGAAVWFVGDTDIDMQCAVGAGCVPVLLREAPPAADEFADAVPACHVPSCAALAALIGRL